MSGTKKPINKLVDVSLTEISLVDRGANQGSAVVLFKRDSEDDDMPTPKEMEALQTAVAKAEEALGELTQANEDLVAKNEELSQKVEQLTGDIAKRDEQIEQIKKRSAGGDEADEITKALDEAPEPVAKAMTALMKRLQLAEDVIAKQAQEKEEREFIAKAQAFDKLPTSADKLGPLLMRVEKGMTTADDAAELERLLKAANEGIGKEGQENDPTVEIGKRGNENGATAEQRIEAKAAEIRKSAPDLSEAEAVTKVLEENPELYEQYVAETRGAR